MDRKPNHLRPVPLHLPPLNALRGFETAARHLSFAMAAKELPVTPARISNKVKGLEESLDHRLFRRLKRGLELTRAGQVLLPRLSEGFGRLGDAVEELRTLDEEASLSVSAATSFATRWLAPRLHRFVSAHPELDVRINASTRLIDPNSEQMTPMDALTGSPVERKSTRLNSSHTVISYALFCLKKKKTTRRTNYSILHRTHPRVRHINQLRA